MKFRPLFGVALASVILLGTSKTLNVWMAMLALLLAMSVTMGILLLGHRIVKVVGERGVEALQRLMGLMLTAVAESTRVMLEA